VAAAAAQLAQGHPANAAPIASSAEQPQGISVDNLPLASPDKPNAAPAAPRPASAAKADAPKSEKSSEPRSERAEKPEPKKAEAPEPEAPVEAEPAPAPKPPKPAQPATPLPPNSERAPLNRGAAIAALGAKGNAAASCKRPGGPTGGGRVMVAFSPDGPVSSV